MKHVKRYKLLGLLVCLGQAVIASAATSTKPNIVVIFTDDHGYADLGCQGIVKDIKTPHIDRLAAGGVRMTSGYVTAPQCVPSRAGLLTGRYQNRFGVESNGEPLDGFNAQLTIAERLKKAGYATGMAGKWHLGPAQQIVNHGFDDVFYKNSNRPGWANFDLNGRTREPGPERSKLYHLDANSAAACAFIRRHHEKPFFFYCAYRAPHVPLDAPKKYLDRFPGEMPQRRRQALAMISAIDDGVGRIMATLRELKLEEKTLIFIIGDNGAPLKIHKLDEPGGGPGWDGSLNDPLNGEKGMLTEGGMRVPFILYWKGQLPEGRVDKSPVISLDVAATAVELAGLPSDPKLDGVNLIPFLRGEKKGSPHESLYWRWIAQSAIRQGKWKYLRGGSRAYLFDVEADREEKHNLLEKHPDVARRLEKDLKGWASQLKPAGLANKKISLAWERYFDHYLDGKLAPKPAANSSEGKFQGWVIRNGRAAIRGGALRVTSKARNRRTFMAVARLKLPRKVTAVVKLRSGKAGRGAISWRESAQKDFVKKQMVSFDCEASEKAVTHRVEIPAQGTVIHVRLTLPAGGADVISVAFEDRAGQVVKSWEFNK